MSIKKYIPSDNNVICDICGRKRKRSECIMAYGSGNIPVVMSCRDGCADYNHPLNYPPPIIFDGRPVPDARPEGYDQFNPLIGTGTGIFHWGHFPQGFNVWGEMPAGGTGEFSFNLPMLWGNF